MRSRWGSSTRPAKPLFGVGRRDDVATFFVGGSKAAFVTWFAAARCQKNQGMRFPGVFCRVPVKPDTSVHSQGTTDQPGFPAGTT